MDMTGPLATLETAIAERLESLGFAQRTAVGHIRLVGKLSGFMQRQGLEVSDLSLEVVERFCGIVRTTALSGPTVKTLAWLLDYLTEIGVVSAPVASPPATWEAELLERYRHYLLVERGLAEQTVALCKEALKRTDIKKEVNLHSLRHSYATHLLEEGLNIVTLKELLGHAEITTTMIYLHVAQCKHIKPHSPLDTLYSQRENQ